MSGELGSSGALVAVAVPLVLAAMLWLDRARAIAVRAAPWAAAPAFVLATGVFGTASGAWDAVLLGTRVGMTDTVTRAFLLLTAGVWLASGLFARTYMASDPRLPRFWTFFLVTLSANVGVVLALDVASFYCAFALMTFAGYGLIVHTQTTEARRAGLVYLVMALLGEMLLVSALFLIVGANINLSLDEVPAAVARSPNRDLIVYFVLAGFGVKAGALLLHVWLPLAHPVAPTPASAVLSAAMIKAGLLAWLRFLPLGVVALPTPGLVCVVAGMSAAFYGMALGVTQRDPKTILAYSSVSQMGFMTATLGVAIAVPATAGTAIAAIVFYAVHHALAKGALFLGTGVASATSGVWPRRLVVLGMLVPALDLAGAPLSSGALAKLSVKDVIAAGPWSWAPLTGLLTLGAIGSTILMAHLLAVISRTAPTHPGPPRLGLWVPWCSLLVVNLALVVSSPVDADPGALVEPGHVWSAIWPVLVGATLLLVAHRVRRGRELRIRVPAGDILVVFERVVRALNRGLIAVVRLVVRGRVRIRSGVAHYALVRRLVAPTVRSVQAGEEALARFGTIGLLFALLAGSVTLLGWLVVG